MSISVKSWKPNIIWMILMLKRVFSDILISFNEMSINLIRCWVKEKNCLQVLEIHWIFIRLIIFEILELEGN